MPTTSDTSNGIDAALSLGATSSDALDQRPEPRRLTVWLGFAFVLHVVGFAAFVVWQPTWFEPRAAVPDVPVDVTWLGVVREPEVTPPAPPPAPPPRPLSTPEAPPPKAVQPPKVAPKISQAATPVATKAKVSEPTPEPAAALVKPSLVAPAVVPSAVLADPPPPLETLTAPLETSLTAVSPPSSTSTPVASTPAAPPSQAPVPAVRSEPTLIASSRQSPVYPRASRRAGEAGTVVLRINIAASGAVTATAVVVSSGFERLDAAAQKAVQQWRFTPGMVDGVPTAMPLQVPIRFELQ